MSALSETHKMEKQTNCSDENLFSNLPSHIIIDILTRLPTKTISRCRCVCKLWLKLVYSTEFSNLCKLRPPTCFMIYSSSHRISVDIVEIENEPRSHDFYSLPEPILDFPKELGPNSTSLFGSINGLLCFHEFGYHCLDRVVLWNPTTCESITIPSPGGLMESPNVRTHGFGLSSGSGHYKVVRIYQELEGQGINGRITKSECHVYSFGQGCWRQLGHAPLFMYSCRSDGVFFNGNLHWLIYDPDGNELISCFDLETESFKPFPAPPKMDKRCLASLEVYKGYYLSLCDNTSDFEIVIWVMEEYGVRESWVKKFVIDKHPVDLVGESYEVVRMLKVFEDGAILLLWRDDMPLSYNSKSNTLQEVDIRSGRFVSEQGSFHLTMNVIDYVSSCISLKSFGMEMVEDTTFKPESGSRVQFEEFEV